MSEVMDPTQTSPAQGAQVSPSVSSGGLTRAGVIDAKHETHRRYTIIDEKDDEIVRTAGELLDGTRLKDSYDLRVANLTNVFKRVATWAETQGDSLVAAWITAEPTKVTLFFVSSAPRYDLKLDRAMTDLEVRLGGSAGVGSVESFQIPERSADQFVGGNAALLWRR